MRNSLSINNNLISEDSKTYIIAEAGVNHNGDINMAKELVDVAIDAGVEAVKFQAFKTKNLILEGVSKASYQIDENNKNSNQFEMLEALEVSKEQNEELQKYCISKGITFLTTPFDEESLDELDVFDLPAIKVASTDATNIPFLRKVAEKQKPIFLSTGMTYLSELEYVLKTILPINPEILLMQCTASYPMSENEANLRVLKTFENKFSLFTGYSDHSLGIGASPFAVALGAKVIEKHFTLDKSLSGPDHKASLSPTELKEFVDEIRNVETFIGSSIKQPTLGELGNRKSLQKCLVASCSIIKGEKLTADNTIAKRTGGVGISPIYCDQVYGNTAPKNFSRNEIIILDK